MAKTDVYLCKSTKSGKKYSVTIGKKTTHFGAEGYSDYTKHKDRERKERYISRHKSKENWNKSGLNTAGFWSRWILWNLPTLKASIKDTEKRFNVKIHRKYCK